MRTGIYVYEATPVSITVSEDGLLLSGLDGRDVPLGKGVRMSLEPGVYRVISGLPVVVDGDRGQLDVIAVAKDKDGWPEPPPRLGNELRIDSKVVKEFFMAAKAIDEP